MRGLHDGNKDESDFGRQNKFDDLDGEVKICTGRGKVWGYSGVGRWSDVRGADETDRAYNDGGGR